MDDGGLVPAPQGRQLGLEQPEAPAVVGRAGLGGRGQAIPLRGELVEQAGQLRADRGAGEARQREPHPESRLGDDAGAGHRVELALRRDVAPQRDGLAGVAQQRGLRQRRQAAEGVAGAVVADLLGQPRGRVPGGVHRGERLHPAGESEEHVPMREQHVGDVRVADGPPHVFEKPVQRRRYGVERRPRGRHEEHPVHGDPPGVGQAPGLQRVRVGLRESRQAGRVGVVVRIWRASSRKASTNTPSGRSSPRSALPRTK